jgi:metal-sulfur cluster biosynthetic enzyme
VYDLLRSVIDPELGADIVSLGMVPGVSVEPDGRVTVGVKLTIGGCPLRAQIQKDAKSRVASLPGVTAVKIDWPELTTEETAATMGKARLNAADPSTVDVYELIINGQEISPGYSELNDPDLQRERLEHQAGEEQQKVDGEFLEALEYGMPPAGGIGIGIDRLVMLLTGAESIREVILFPHLKQRLS